MDLEEDVFCNVCGLHHLTDLCPLLNSGIRILDTCLPSKAILTLPKNVEAKLLVPGKYDITAKTRIPKGVQFGPLDAPRFNEFNPKCSYMLKLFQGKHNFYFLDTSDENKCNWMTLVPFTDNHEARNCICYQLCDDIFFTVVVDIKPGQSLLVAYSPGYLSRLQEESKSQSSLTESFASNHLEQPSHDSTTFDEKTLIENVDQNDCPTAVPDKDFEMGTLLRRSGRKRKAVEFKNYVFSLVEATSPQNEHSTGFTEVVNSGSNYPVINSSILAEEETDSFPPKFDESSSISADRESSCSDEGTSDFDGERLPSRPYYPKRKFTRLGAVLAADEWQCKFCHKIEITIAEFASHLIEHYKTVGAARTEKSRLTKLSDHTSSEDTAEENSIKEEPSELSTTEPRYPYYCDICAVKKVFNRGEYIIRHLRMHTGELYESVQDDDMNGNSHKCTICDKSCRSEKKLQLHVDTVHLKGTSSSSPSHRNSKSQKLSRKIEAYTQKCRKAKSTTTTPVNSKERDEEEILVLHNCELCQSTFSKAKDLEKHLKKNHGESITCSLCGKFLTNRTYKIHHSICQMVSEFSSGALLKCPKCCLTMDDLNRFRSHVATHTHPAMCPECNLRLPSTLDIKSHNCVRFRCDGCPDGFETLINFKKHIAQVHGQAEFYCFECAIPFVSEDGFNEHKGCGAPEKVEQKKTTSQDECLYVCEVCGATYTKWSSLKTHRYTHGPKRFACSVCGKSFHRKEMLADHEFVHQDAQFQCAECGKKLKSKKSLDVHMQIHKGNKRFQCDRCSKAFCQKINLQTHMLSHLPSEEKGFECSYCHKKFASKEYLGFHIEGHVKGKNQVCDICGRSFVKSHMLNHHRKTTHGNQRYTCEFCNLVVRQKHSLTRHLSNRHDDIKNKWDFAGYLDSRFEPGDGTYDNSAKIEQPTEDENGDVVYAVSDDNTEMKSVDLQKVQLLAEVIEEHCQVETEEAFTNDNIVIPENMMILQVEEGGEIVLTLAGPDTNIPGATVVERMIVEDAALELS